MASFESRYDFFGIADDKVVYDERKKRFAHTKDLPGHLARQYNSSGFKSVSISRPSQTAHGIIVANVYSLTSAAKARSHRHRPGAIQDERTLRWPTHQIHELPDQARNAKNVARHGPDGLQLLLRKSIVHSTSFKDLTLFSIQPLLDDYMSAAAMDRPKMQRLWSWEDSTRMANFITLHMMKAQKYGLDFPHFNNRLFTKEELKQKEDELTEYFLYEMRKPAAS